jgi:hypothetical protein
VLITPQFVGQEPFLLAETEREHLEGLRGKYIQQELYFIQQADSCCGRYCLPVGYYITPCSTGSVLIIVSARKESGCR